MNTVLRAIDVFSGGGGLTVGLKQAGFTVVGAIEIERHASATYRANHRGVPIFEQDVTTVSGTDLLERSRCERIDLLAGCPPCQGFTSLTHKSARNDSRNNKLVYEIVRLAKETKARAIMMENVPGLMTRGAAIYRRLKEELTEMGYVLTEDVLNVADYGVPQFRRRLVLLGGFRFKIELPARTHSGEGCSGLSRWKTVRDSIGHMGMPLDFQEAKKQDALQRSAWHVVRSLSEDNQKRIELAIAGKSRTEIPEEFRPSCHQGEYRGFTNVYGRMAWDQPSPTITGGCTTFSKGRFGHPTQNRTISVREAALLQTFPEDYNFDTPYMEYVCNIVGNALPCEFAAAVARACYGALISGRVNGDV